MNFIQQFGVCIIMAGCAATPAQAVVTALSACESSAMKPAALCYTVTIPSSGSFAGEALFNTDSPFSTGGGFTILARDENDTPGGGPGGDFEDWDETPSPGDVGGDMTPEPGSAGLILLGAAGILLRRKMK